MGPAQDDETEQLMESPFTNVCMHQAFQMHVASGEVFLAARAVSWDDTSSNTFSQFYKKGGMRAFVCLLQQSRRKALVSHLCIGRKRGKVGTEKIL